MTFGWVPFVGCGIEVTDIWLGDSEDDPDPDKHIWIVLYLPFCRIGLVV